MIPTLLGVAVLIFFLMRVVPGDLVELRFAGESAFAQKENLDMERARLGLDQPLWKQFLVWIAGVVRLDFGKSMWTGAPIIEEIKLRFALSLQLAIMATIIAVLLAIPLGVLTVIALEFAFLMGGLVVTEQVFNLNGLGLLFVEAVAHRDYTLTQALVMLVAFVFIFVNFLVDLAYAWLDPRIRFR